jgi:hypothetical protein
MIANNEAHNARESQRDNDQGYYFKKRQKQERRTEPSEGYTYISIVGWIDRRERLRRKDDR